MDVNDVLKKYSKKIEQEMNTHDSSEYKSIKVESVSKDYNLFKSEMMPELSRYEKWAKSFFRVRISKKDELSMQKQLNIAHLDVTPSEVAGFAFAGLLGGLFIGLLVSLAIWFIFGNFPVLFLVLMLFVSIFIFYYLYSMPSRLAIKWRLKASSQMVPAILYTVIYMKHTSNLERAIDFVSKHIEAPLSLDLKKVLWDVETGKYSNIRDSLDDYLDFWKDFNMEFVESFHMIESSLFEPSDQRRIQILERALKVILDGVYEEMLRYTHNIKSPLTNLYMLGIVLPTLGLALLPLASTLLGGMVTWVHIFLLFNILVPFLVYYLTLQIMLKRPGGYGETSLLEKNPLYYKYVSKKPYYIAAMICVPMLILGLIPIIFGYTPLPAILGISNDFPLSSVGLGFLGKGDFFYFITNENGTFGPFGVGALLLSLLIPLSIALFFSIAYNLKTKELIKARDETKDLEREFNSSLFTLGNRIGDGTPAEIAFLRVAESTRGQKTENFFRIVNTNIQSMGMSIEDAIFNPKRGVLLYYPSSLIATSMRILIESSKKGLRVAAQSLIAISDYVKNIKKIEERLRDLLAEVVSDMSSNMTFLAPLLSGIVIGLAAMITGILGQLKIMLDMTGDASIAGFGNIGGILKIFEITNMIPPYFLQIAIGLYIIQIIFILTGTLVTIDSGEDKLKQTNEISKNLIRGIVLYLITAFGAIIALSALSSVALTFS